MLILWLKVEVVLGEWPRRKRRRREPELFEDDFHGVFECHAEDVGGLRKGDGRGIGVDGGHLVLDAGQATTTLRPSSLPNSASNRTSLPSLPSPEPFGGVVAHVVFKITLEALMVSMGWPGKRSPSSSVNSVGVENLMVQERIFPVVRRCG